MKAISTPDTNRILKAPKSMEDICIDLPCQGTTESGFSVIKTTYELTADEIHQLITSRQLVVTVVGRTIQPMRVEVVPGPTPTPSPEIKCRKPTDCSYPACECDTWEANEKRCAVCNSTVTRMDEESPWHCTLDRMHDWEKQPGAPAPSCKFCGQTMTMTSISGRPVCGNRECPPVADSGAQNWTAQDYQRAQTLPCGCLSQAKSACPHGNSNIA